MDETDSPGLEAEKARHEVALLLGPLDLKSSTDSLMIEKKSSAWHIRTRV